MRELVNLNKNKLKEKDRIFLLERNHAEILHYDSMLMNNNFILFTIFTLFVALISLVIGLEVISNLSKVLFSIVLVIGVIFLMVKFYISKKRLNADKKRLVDNSSDLFKQHLNYAVN